MASPRLTLGKSARSNGLSREPGPEAPRRLGDLLGRAGEAEPDIALAAGPEGRAWGGAEARFVDEPLGENFCVGRALHRAEEAKRRLPPSATHAPGRGQGA